MRLLVVLAVARAAAALDAGRGAQAKQKGLEEGQRFAMDNHSVILGSAPCRSEKACFFCTACSTCHAGAHLYTGGSIFVPDSCQSCRDCPGDQYFTSYCKAGSSTHDTVSCKKPKDCAFGVTVPWYRGSPTSKGHDNVCNPPPPPSPGTPPAPPPVPPWWPRARSRVGNKRLQRAFAESKAACVEKDRAVEEKMLAEDDNLIASMNEMVQDKIGQAQAMDEVPINEAKEFRHNVTKFIDNMNAKLDAKVGGGITHGEWPGIEADINTLVAEMNGLV